MMVSLILKRYFLTLGIGVSLAFVVFTILCGFREESIFFILTAVLLSLITAPIPIVLVLQYNAISDLDEEDIEEKLRITHVMTAAISAFLEMFIAYYLLGGEGYAIFGSVAVLIVYVCYLISSMVVRFLPYAKKEGPNSEILDDN